MSTVLQTRDQLMDGKKIIVIGGGPHRLLRKWPAASSYGIKVVLVEIDPNPPSKEIVHCYIHYDFSDHTKDHDHALKIVSMIHDIEIVADGCVTFWDECTHLAALLCELLGLRGSSCKATMKANLKTQTQNTLSMRIKGLPDKFHTYKFSTRAFHLTKESDCDLLPNSFKFPAILKLDNGTEAAGACVVYNGAEMKSKFSQITSIFRNEPDYHGCIDNSMTTMELFSGTEHIVDVVLYDKNLVCAFITDSGVVRQPYFIATARRMPSFLSEDVQAKLIDVAVRCCLSIGLTDGTFNVEIIITPDGPKLIEINARAGGYVLSTWLKKLYGVDIMLYAMMISCGIKPKIPDLSVNKVLMGVMVVPSLHAHLQKEGNFKNKLSKMIKNEEVFYVQWQKLREISTPYEKPFGNIGVTGSSSKESKQKLIGVCKALDIDQEDYRVETFIQNF